MVNLTDIEVAFTGGWKQPYMEHKILHLEKGMMELHPDGELPLSNYLDVGPDQCRWPIADGCCGRPTFKNSYCETHARRAYRGRINP